MYVKFEAFVSDLELVVEIYREERIKQFQSYEEDDYVTRKIAYYKNASIEDLARELFYEKMFDMKDKYGIDY